MTDARSRGITAPPADLAARIEIYIGEAPGDGGHCDAAGANCWELLREAMEELRAQAGETKSAPVQPPSHSSDERLPSGDAAGSGAGTFGVAQPSSGSADALDGLAERLDRLLLTSQENDRFVLSTESATNIVGIVREWIRTRGVAQPSSGTETALLSACVLALCAAREYIGEDNNPRSNRVLQRIKNALDAVAGGTPGVAQRSVDSGEAAFAWRVARGQKMYVGMVTADPKVRDVWLEAELDVEPLYAAPQPLDPAYAQPKLSAEDMDALESLARCMGFGRTFHALSRALEIVKGESSVPSTNQLPPDWKQDQAETSRLPKVRTSHHRNKEEAALLQALVNERLCSCNASERDGQHMGWCPVSSTHRGMTRERTTSEVAAEIGVEPYVLRKWKYRGLLKLAPQGVSGQGRSVECMWSEEAFAEAKARAMPPAKRNIGAD